MLDNGKKNIIFESNRITGVNEIEKALNYAIDNKFVVTMQYKQKGKLEKGQTRIGTAVRFIEPWGIGNDKRTNRRNLRVFQLKGDSTSGKKAGFWKTISLDSIINVVVLDGENNTSLDYIQNRSEFKINDEHISFSNYVGKNRQPEQQPEVEPELSVTAPSQPGQQTQAETEPIQNNNTQQLAEQIKRIKKLIKY